MNKLLLCILAVGCFFTSHALSLEAIENPPIDLFACDENNDGFATFDLTVNNAIVLGSQNPADFQITYHLTQADAANNTNPIPNPNAYTSSNTVIFVRVGDITDGSSEIGLFNVIVEVLPSANPVEDITQCADNPGINGVPTQDLATFNLTQQDNVITNGEPETSVSYYTSLEDAQNMENEIANPTSYTNTSNPQTIYAQSINLNSLCVSEDIIEFQILVEPLPFTDLSDNSGEICVDETTGDVLDPFILDGTVEDPIAGVSYAYIWTRDGTLVSFEPIVLVDQEGSYQVIITATYDNGAGVITSCNYTASAAYVAIICPEDTDNDGVPDEEEDLNSNGNLEDDDTDNDDIPNYLDDDDDGDLVMTIDEITGIGAGFSPQDFIDTDDDMIENYLDDDDDGDTVLTRDEDYNNSGSPLDDDTNDNGIPDFLDPEVALSTDEFEVTNFSIYPNPVIDNITITASIPFEKMSIYDITGRLVLEQAVVPQITQTLELSKIKSGMYFIRIDNQSNVLRFIKK